ncbi:unnamed protein product [Vitrella brassicaformis CCMP3155]|uniref:Uncharacterized protein n=1 Tax=Vitrella brassicaformis (strain CCMP3155) TaxID=1169540 RepID=A0A0G4F9B2_VITBC|nr:unnamed protein product [Vitrella brassicaformis CCMP3155]|eukprot:CEM08851.1 unnamed protein product [Vitrella brassicaformis CCMP3155]
MSAVTDFDCQLDAPTKCTWGPAERWHSRCVAPWQCMAVDMDHDFLREPRTHIACTIEALDKLLKQSKEEKQLWDEWAKSVGGSPEPIDKFLEQRKYDLARGLFGQCYCCAPLREEPSRVQREDNREEERKRKKGRRARIQAMRKRREAANELRHNGVKDTGKQDKQMQRDKERQKLTRDRAESRLRTLLEAVGVEVPLEGADQPELQPLPPETEDEWETSDELETSDDSDEWTPDSAESDTDGSLLWSEGSDSEDEDEGDDVAW